MLRGLRNFFAAHLQSLLEKYLVGVEVEALGLLGGDVVLEDVELRENMLGEALKTRLPHGYDVASGSIRSLTISIPWTRLLSQPVVVKLHSVQLVLAPHTQPEETDEDKEEQHGETSEQGAATSKSEAEKADPNPSWVQSLLKRVAMNVTMEVQNVVMKIESPSVPHSNKKILGLFLRGAHLSSADPGPQGRTAGASAGDWPRMSMTDECRALGLVAKRFDLTGLTLCIGEVVERVSGVAGSTSRHLQYEEAVFENLQVTVNSLLHREDLIEENGVSGQNDGSVRKQAVADILDDAMMFDQVAFGFGYDMQMDEEVEEEHDDPRSTLCVQLPNSLALLGDGLIRLPNEDQHPFSDADEGHSLWDLRGESLTPQASGADNGIIGVPKPKICVDLEVPEVAVRLSLAHLRLLQSFCENLAYVGAEEAPELRDEAVESARLVQENPLRKFWKLGLSVGAYRDIICFGVHVADVRLMVGQEKDGREIFDVSIRNITLDSTVGVPLRPEEENEPDIEPTCFDVALEIGWIGLSMEPHTGTFFTLGATSTSPFVRLSELGASTWLPDEGQEPEDVVLRITRDTSGLAAVAIRMSRGYGEHSDKGKGHVCTALNVLLGKVEMYYHHALLKSVMKLLSSYRVHTSAMVFLLSQGSPESSSKEIAGSYIHTVWLHLAVPATEVTISPSTISLIGTESSEGAEEIRSVAGKFSISACCSDGLAVPSNVFVQLSSLDCLKLNPRIPVISQGLQTPILLLHGFEVAVRWRAGSISSLSASLSIDKAIILPNEGFVVLLQLLSELQSLKSLENSPALARNVGIEMCTERVGGVSMVNLRSSLAFNSLDGSSAPCMLDSDWCVPDFVISVTLHMRDFKLWRPRSDDDTTQTPRRILRSLSGSIAELDMAAVELHHSQILIGMPPFAEQSPVMSTQSTRDRSEKRSPVPDVVRTRRRSYSGSPPPRRGRIAEGLGRMFPDVGDGRSESRRILEAEFSASCGAVLAAVALKNQGLENALKKNVRKVFESLSFEIDQAGESKAGPDIQLHPMRAQLQVKDVLVDCHKLHELSKLISEADAEVKENGFAPILQNLEGGSRHGCSFDFKASASNVLLLLSSRVSTKLESVSVRVESTMASASMKDDLMSSSNVRMTTSGFRLRYSFCRSMRQLWSMANEGRSGIEVSRIDCRFQAIRDRNSGDGGARPVVHRQAHVNVERVAFNIHPDLLLQLQRCLKLWQRPRELQRTPSLPVILRDTSLSVIVSVALDRLECALCSGRDRVNELLKLPLTFSESVLDGAQKCEPLDSEDVDDDMVILATDFGLNVNVEEKRSSFRLFLGSINATRGLESRLSVGSLATLPRRVVGEVCGFLNPKEMYSFVVAMVPIAKITLGEEKSASARLSLSQYRLLVQQAVVQFTRHACRGFRRGSRRTLVSTAGMSSEERQFSSAEQASRRETDYGIEVHMTKTVGDKWKLQLRLSPLLLAADLAAADRVLFLAKIWLLRNDAGHRSRQAAEQAMEYNKSEHLKMHSFNMEVHSAGIQGLFYLLKGKETGNSVAKNRMMRIVIPAFEIIDLPIADDGYDTNSTHVRTLVPEISMESVETNSEEDVRVVTKLATTYALLIECPRRAQTSFHIVPSVSNPGGLQISLEKTFFGAFMKSSIAMSKSFSVLDSLFSRTGSQHLATKPSVVVSCADVDAKILDGSPTREHLRPYDSRGKDGEVPRVSQLFVA